jgi:hypothetical protein
VLPAEARSRILPASRSRRIGRRRYRLDPRPAPQVPGRSLNGP